MKRFYSRGGKSFLITMMACVAFLVGAVKIGSVSPDKIWSGLLVVVVMVVCLALLALIAAALMIAVKKYLERQSGGR